MPIEIKDEWIKHVRLSLDLFYAPGAAGERRYICDVLKAVAPLIAEECAKIAETLPTFAGRPTDHGYKIAAEIRARATSKKELQK